LIAVHPETIDTYQDRYDAEKRLPVEDLVDFLVRYLGGNVVRPNASPEAKAITSPLRQVLSA